jgi:predicted nucleotidyltransferase
MRADEILRLLESRRDDLARLGVQSLALFGSMAREDARPDSDADFLVEFEGGATFDRYVELSFLLEELLGCPVDLVTRRSVHPALRPSVEKDSRCMADLASYGG